MPPSIEVMTCLQFYQRGMDKPFAMSIYLSSFDIMDFHLLL